MSTEPTDPAALADDRIEEARRMFESDALEAEYAGQANALRVARTGLALIASHRSLAELREQREGEKEAAALEVACIIHEAILEEREACARVCEEEAASHRRYQLSREREGDANGAALAFEAVMACRGLASAIRSRASTASPAPGKEGGR